MRDSLFVLLASWILACTSTTAQPAPRTIQFVATPRLEHRDGTILLVVTDRGRQYEFFWGVSPDVVREKLAPNQQYIFTVALIPIHGETFPELTRVHQGKNVIYDIGTCERHYTPMEHKVVKVIHGPEEPNRPPEAIELRFFPHRREVAYGPCVIDEDSVLSRTTELYVCRHCKAAYSRWKLNRHGP